MIIVVLLCSAEARAPPLKSSPDNDIDMKQTQQSPNAMNEIIAEFDRVWVQIQQIQQDMSAMKKDIKALQSYNTEANNQPSVA